MRFKGMKAGIFLLIILILSIMGSCKKYCYTCTQYCAYCVNLSDSTIHLKACANETQGETEVNSYKQTWTNQGFDLTLLDPAPANFCDDKNGASSAVNYYAAEDYYCYPQQ